ncbi:MAG: hypothetical protein H6705_08760 [Myxococcales bacterium]|nr:hypothetical protein [Myxococcales bacterium]
MISVLGCDEGARSRVEPGDPGDGRLAADVGRSDAVPDGDPADAAPPDLAPPDAAADAAPPDAAPPDAAAPDLGPSPVCRVDVERIPRDEHFEFEPILDRAELYATARSPDGLARTVRLRDGAPVGGPADRLITARDGAFLLARPDGDRGARLIYRDAGGDRALAEAFTHVIGWRRVDWRPPRLVEPDHAIYLLDARLFEWRRGADPVPIGDGVGQAALDGGDVAWLIGDSPAEPPGGAWLVVHRAGQPDRSIGPFARPLPESLRLSRGHVWWLAEGGQPVSHAIASGAQRSHAIDGCHDLDADGPVAVAACGEPGAQRLVRLDADGEPRRLADAAQLVAPRIADGWIAYAAYDDPDAWCAAGPLTIGRVYWHPLDAPAEPIAEIASGCLCCGAFWPQLVFELGDDTLAWSYGIPGARDAAIGVARRTCDRDD